MFGLELKKGDSVKITLTESDEYEGIVHSINCNGRSITLQNVKDLSTNVTFPTFYNYQENEIRNIQLIKSSTPTAPKVIVPEIIYSERPEPEVSEKLGRHETERLREMQNQFIYIKDKDQKYTDAIKDLKSSENIGVFVKNNLIFLSTWAAIYVFDLGRSDEIEAVLKSEDILKICHGGAKLNLVNVFDTQIADILIRNDRRLRRLEECVKDYLKLSVVPNDDEEIPRRFDELKIATQDVVYLISLKNEMQKRLHDDFWNRSVQFMNSLKDMSPGEAFYWLKRNTPTGKQ